MSIVISGGSGEPPSGDRSRVFFLRVRCAHALRRISGVNSLGLDAGMSIICMVSEAVAWRRCVSSCGEAGVAHFDSGRFGSVRFGIGVYLRVV